MFLFDGTLINYKYSYIGEDKKCILFLHGYGADSKSFDYYFNRLKNDYNIVTIDFPPFGLSSKLHNPWSVEDYAKMVYFLLKFLNITKTNIISHSFGGRVAILLATRYNVCEKLVLISSAGLKPKFNIIKKFKVFIYKVKKYFKLDVSKYGSSDYNSLDDLTKISFNKIIHYYQNNMCKKLKNQTLIIWGKNDKETPLYMAKKFKKYIKNSKLIVYDSDHYVHIYKKDLALKNIKTFLGDVNDVLFSK